MLKHGLGFAKVSDAAEAKAVLHGIKDPQFLSTPNGLTMITKSRNGGLEHKWLFRRRL